MPVAFRVLFGYYQVVESLIGEKIKVISLFENGQIKPILFKWQNRVYKILKIAFSYSKNIGRQKILYFTLETRGGMFEITFNLEELSWELNKIF